MPHDRKARQQNGEGELDGNPQTPQGSHFPVKLAHLSIDDRMSTFNATADQNQRPEIGHNAVANYSKYQQNIIKNYYQNQDAILLQRLGEQVTELYLAEGKARARRWKDIAKILEKLKVPAERIENLLQRDDPALVAKLLEELLAKQK